MSQTSQNPAESDAKTMQLSCFFLGDTLCGIDIATVQEINEDLMVSKAPLAPAYIVGIMNLRGQIVTVVDLKKKIGLAGQAEAIQEDAGDARRIVIVMSRGEYIGLLVDRVTEVLTVTSFQIAEPPPNIRGAQGKYFQGVIQTGEHHLLAVLDVDAVLTEDEARASRDAGQRA